MEARRVTVVTLISETLRDDLLTSTRSYAVDADTWRVKAFEEDDAVGDWQLTAVANCLNG